jgi:hypothetical protein
VYLSPHEFVYTGDGRKCSACFFEPYDRNVEPFIRIATGDYRQLKDEMGRDSALASFIVSLAHEIVHYQQWLGPNVVSEHGVARKATAMLRQYGQIRSRP